MKKIGTLLFLLVTAIASTFAQAQAPPELISYRAVTTAFSQPISVRFTILDAANMGSPLYSETQSGSTNASGAYNFNIGAGPATIGVFANIDWKLGSKYLKVETNVNNAGFTVAGITQLLTVPYAFYAKEAKNAEKAQNAANGVPMIANVNALRNSAPVPAPGENNIVYLKGYYTEGDGGQGFFRYDPNEDFVDNGGIFFKPASVQGNGRWVRLYSGYVNIMYFGVQKEMVEGTIVPASDRIQAAIDYAAVVNDPGAGGYPFYFKEAGGLTLYFPSGTYFLDKTVRLRSHVSIKGESGTQFKPIGGFSGDYMFALNEKILERLNVEDVILALDGRRVGGFNLAGSAQKDGTGGLWRGVFRNIQIKDVSTVGINVEGSHDHFRLPFQYVLFENVHIVRVDESSNCLSVSGLVVNVTFLRCDFEVPFSEKTSNSGANIVMWNTNPWPNIAGISFVNCATGGGVQYGAKLNNANNVNFENCWFEDTDIAVDLDNCQAVTITNCRFANAAGMGSKDRPSFMPQGTGRCISLRNSWANIENNFTSITLDDKDEKGIAERIKGEKFITGLENNNVINARNNYFNDMRINATFGIVQDPIVITDITAYHYPSIFTRPGIETGGQKIVRIDASEPNPQDLFRINSLILAGETLLIRCEAGKLTFHTYNPQNEMGGNNIYLGGLDSVTLTAGQTAYFMKMDGVNNYETCVYQMISKF